MKSRKRLSHLVLLRIRIDSRLYWRRALSYDIQHDSIFFLAALRNNSAKKKRWCCVCVNFKCTKISEKTTTQTNKQALFLPPSTAYHSLMIIENQEKYWSWWSIPWQWIGYLKKRAVFFFSFCLLWWCDRMTWRQQVYYIVVMGLYFFFMQNHVCLLL